MVRDDTALLVGIALVGIGAYALAHGGKSEPVELSIGGGGGGRKHVPERKYVPLGKQIVAPPPVKLPEPKIIIYEEPAIDERVEHVEPKKKKVERVVGVKTPTEREIRKMEEVARARPERAVYFPEHGTLMVKTEEGVVGYSVKPEYAEELAEQVAPKPKKSELEQYIDELLEQGYVGGYCPVELPRKEEQAFDPIGSVFNAIGGLFGGLFGGGG